jgi:twitching motility protein PilJ
MAQKNPSIRLLSPLIWVALAGAFLTAVLLVLLREPVGPAQSNGNGLAAIAQNLSLNAAAAVAGDQSAYDALGAERQRLQGALGKDAKQFADNASVQKVLSATTQVLENREATLAAHEVARHALTAIPQLLQDLGNIVSGFGAVRVESMSKQIERFEQTGDRLKRDLQALADGVGDPTKTAQSASEGMAYLGQVFGELAGEDAGLGFSKVTGVDGEIKLKALTAVYRKLGDEVHATLSTAEKVAASHQASREVLAAYKSLLPALAPNTGAVPTSTPIPWLPLAMLGVVLVALVGLLAVNTSAHRISRELRKQAEQNERNQTAILRLLDELSNLADGDLTVQATVTEDITGAIADSINYAIEALRELVATINRTAITLDSGAKQTLASAGHLAKASVAQSKQVVSASESAAAMAQSVEEVSGNAERSSDVARHAVDISHKGGDAVRRTIDGMNAIRETIQETSKRIKRLGESSQEIGNIVELINDIAEQTNILALNASIQASMAGEAGRGFAVVADEVQRLAERAANATKQIEVLVRTIQADTNEAVVSMERSTTDVVGGALLAENAGAALEEIEQVSNQIASLVQNISASARHQTGSAQDIARNMQVLREISAQTAENSAATTNSIGKLAQLSTLLRKSVAGFRLPEAAGRALPESASLPAAPAKAASGTAAKPAPRPVGRMTA